jgi:hydrogenase maturation protease
MTGTGGQAAAPRKVLVIGLGNPDRGDDAVGAIVAQDLGGRLPADVPVFARRGDMLSLIEDWAGFDALVCVDAAAPLGDPGRIHRIDLRASTLTKQISLTSSHGLGLVEVIELASALHLEPREIIVYAIEGASFDNGTALTPAVATAARVVADRVLADVGRLQYASMVDVSDA